MTRLEIAFTVAVTAATYIGSKWIFTTGVDLICAIYQ
jgi:hypothetical protein